MKSISTSDVASYVAAHIGDFHQKRLDSLGQLQLQKILKRKNPYLFKAKNILTASDLVKGLLDAHLSSQEEAIFGTFLEGLAIFVCKKVHGGRKSTAEGIDLEFEQKGMKYIIAIKSGPNWGNSGQIKNMKANFTQAKRILRTNAHTKNIVAVNGCCYGQDRNPDKGEYFKYCGQTFWGLISGNDDLYTDIIEPLGYHAKERNKEFTEKYSNIINKFTLEFTNLFCTKDGAISWDELVKFNSAANRQQKNRKGEVL